MNNKKARWVKFFDATRNGRLLDRPAYHPEWIPHKVYHSPVYGALQSSYEDVEKELRVMSGKPPADYSDSDVTYPAAFASAKIMFVAGDGLALMRLNHLLANKPDLYIDQTPFIIPVQGESTHTYHIHTPI